MAGVWLAGGRHDQEADEIDLVIPVRVGEHNEQLRYALRSFAKHLPHGRVWIVGHKPTWLTGVHHIPTWQGSSKYANTTRAVRAACEHPDVSEVFLLANDDMFAMERHEFMPVYHRGLVAEVEEYYRRRRIRSQYLEGMRATRQLLARLGYEDPLSYEVHVPLPVDKSGMLEALEYGKSLPVVHKRTLYGNLAGLGGTRIRDPKVLHTGSMFPKDGPWLSTMSRSFTHGQVGKWIRSRFPEPSRYEHPRPAAAAAVPVRPAQRRPVTVAGLRRAELRH